VAHPALRRSRRALRWLAAVSVALSAALASVAFAAQAEPLAVQSIDTAKYPKVTVRVVLPAQMISGRTLSPGDFAVRENGAAVGQISARALTAERDAMSVVLVIDVSGSMKGSALDDAKRAATGFVEAMGPADRIALLTFSDRSSIVSTFTTDKAALASAISGLAAARETALYDALSSAAAQAKSVAGGASAIVLLSDGGDTMSAATLDSTARALADAGAPVYAVALRTKEYNLTALQSLTRASGGALVSASESAQLADMFAGIARQLQSPYEITYTSNRPTTKELEIDVTVTSGGNRATASAVAANPEFARPAVTPTQAPALPFSGWPLVISMFAFVAVGMFTGGLMMVLRPEPNTLRQLDYYEQLRRTGDAGAGDVTAPDSNRGRLMGVLAAVASKGGFEAAVRAELEKAALPLRPVEYMTLHLSAVVVIGGLTQLLGGTLLVTVGVVILLSLGPILLLHYLAQKRTEAFQAQLPDVLSLIAGSLRAGWGLLQAVGIVVSEMGRPAGPEFGRVVTEARLGLPLEEALAKMADRVGSEDFKWAVTAISIQREVGGNLAEVLDIVSATVRERDSLRREISSLTSEGRLSAIILIALPFVEGILLSIVNPGYIVKLIAEPIGLIATLVAVFLLVVGALWLRSIVKIEV
jgi:tight adherence protein B